MDESRGAGRTAAFEDRRMWRLLLARLHPDAGGDTDLFAFACALREETLGAGRNASPAPASFLETWKRAMDRWASSNRDALRRF